MDWPLFCPQCCCVVESLRSLAGVHNHYHCSFCQIELRGGARRVCRRSPSPSSPRSARSRSTIPSSSPPGTTFFKYRQHARRRAAGRHAVRRRQGGADPGHRAICRPARPRRCDVDVERGIDPRRQPRRQAGLLFTVDGAPSPAPGHALSSTTGQTLQHATAQAWRPARSRSRSKTPPPSAASFVLAVLPPGVDVAPCAAQLRAVPHRQAPAHHADLPRPLPLRGDPRQRGHRRQGHRAALHRPQGLDRALRPHRRSQRLRARAAAFRAPAGRHGPPRRRDHQDDRRRRDGGVPEPGRRRAGGARHARDIAAFNRGSPTAR